MKYLFPERLDIPEVKPSICCPKCCKSTVDRSSTFERKRRVCLCYSQPVVRSGHLPLRKHEVVSHFNKEKKKKKRTTDRDVKKKKLFKLQLFFPGPTTYSFFFQAQHISIWICTDVFIRVLESAVSLTFLTVISGFSFRFCFFLHRKVCFPLVVSNSCFTSCFRNTIHLRNTIQIWTDTQTHTDTDTDTHRHTHMDRAWIADILCLKVQH